MSDNKLPQNPAVDIHVDSPLKIHFRADGSLDVMCYQGAVGLTTPIAMYLKFSPRAAGSLVKGIGRMLDQGEIALEESSNTDPPH